MAQQKLSFTFLYLNHKNTYNFLPANVLIVKLLQAALKLLKSDLTDISKEATVDPKYILLYFYYGALILTAVKVSYLL